MDYYGDRYIQLRNDKIINFAGMSSDFDKLEYNNLKTLFSLHKSQIKNIQANGNEFVFTFEKETVLKALYGDIEYFYTRMFAQEYSLFNSVDHVNSDWAIVTAYYYSFFAANTFLRMSYKGALFFDRELASDIAGILQQYSSVSQFAKGNYSYSVENITISSIDIILVSTKSVGVHENTWIIMDNLLRDIKSSKVETISDEYTLLAKIIEINNKLGKRYPSQTRNRVNYQAKYGFEAIRNTLQKEYIVSNEERALKRILTFKSNKVNKNSINADLLFSYGYYLALVTDKLYVDLISRMEGKKDVIKIRERFLARISG